MDRVVRTVLLIAGAEEDQRAIRHALHAATTVTYHLLMVENGAQALAVLRQQPPDCLLVANQWPAGDSLAFLQGVVQQAGLHRYPIVLLADVSNTTFLAQGVHAGAHELLFKADLTAATAQQAIEQAVAKVAALRQVAEQHDWQRLALVAADVAVIVTDQRGRITLLNPAAEVLTGLQAAAAQGQPLHQLLHLRDESTHQPIRDLIPAAADPMRSQSQHAQLVGADGQVQSIEYSIGLRHDHQGQASGIVFTLRDITAHKAAEETLRFQASLLDYAYDAVIATDAQMFITAWNRGAEELFGWPATEVLGRKAHEVVRSTMTPDARAAALRQMAEQGRFRVEQITYHRDGTPIFIEGQNAAMRDATGQIIGYMGINRDIRERKQAEADAHFLATLSEQIRLAKDATDLMATTVCLVSEHLQVARSLLLEADLATDRLVMRAQYSQGLPPMPNELRLSAYSAATRADLSAGRVVINADTQHDPRTAPLYATIYAPQQARAVVNVPLFYEGAWRGLLTVFTTEPRQWQAHEIQLLETVAERVWLAVEKLRLDLALRRSEEQLRLITEHMPGLIGLFNEREEYLFMNRYYQEKLGLNREQSIGQSVRTLLGETAYAVAQPALRRALAGESVTFENRLMTTSGVPVDLVVTLVPYWVDKQVQGCYVMAIDITERKRQERQLQELNATLDQRVTERTEQLEQKNVELERSNKELDKFAYIASHDLRAPLRAIDNLSSWIAEDAGHLLPEPSKEHLAKLRGRVRRMEKLLEDLLAYSRIGRFSYNCERLVIKQVLQESLALLNLPPTFHVTLVEPLPVIWAQRVPLELVLRNLIGNAIKHHHRSDGHVQIAAHEKERWVEFVISDDGPGIDPRFHDKIFEIFQTLQPRDTVEGSGVGLALVKKAIDLVGGTIAVESTTGAGATFRFTWPKLARAA